MEERRASENPYCMRCGKHLGMAFHETSEHDEARERADRLAENSKKEQ